MLNLFEHIVYIVDEVLNSTRKRHIVGGFLVSAALLFGGIAATIFTLSKEEQ